MLKHIVIFRLKNSVDTEAGARELTLLKSSLEELKKHIPEIQKLEVGVNAISSPTHYDLLLHTEFQNQEALEIYRKHPAHQKVLNLIHELCSERAVVDYWG